MAQVPPAAVPSDWQKKVTEATPSPKKLISLRIDADVLDWFRQQGDGYQTRMNAVLRVHMQHQRTEAHIPKWS